jgi:hypothetical protein
MSSKAKQISGSQEITTDGGAYTDGNISTGNDFVGRNKIINSGRYVETQIDIGLFSANLSGAVSIIRQLLPNNDENALQRLLDALNQLRLQQKRINELKQIHNMLHRLEVYFNVMQISPSVDFATLRQIRETWRATARPQLITLAYFAETEMAYLGDPRFCQTESSISGPRWIIDLWTLKAHLESGFQEGAIIEVADLVMAMLDSCREHLFVIDSRLLDAITQLDKYSDAIVRVLDND